MSPFLYILVADSVIKILNIIKDEWNILGITFVRGVQSINHVQFTDDTILMGRASTQIVRRLKSSFDIFLKESGNKVNSNRSWLYGWNNNYRILREISLIVEIKVSYDGPISTI